MEPEKRQTAIRRVRRACCAAFAGVLAAAVLPQRVVAECTNADPPRLELRMYKYNGSETGEAKNRFSSFYAIVREKLTLIKDEARADGIDLAYLQNLKVKPDAKNFSAMEPPPDDDGLAATWEFHQRHLLLMYGNLQPDDTSTYRAVSSLFWGPLGPPRIGTTVTAEVPVTPDGSMNARDSHSMVMLVALALDAMRRHCDPALARHLLVKADHKALDLERRGQLVGDLVALQALIRDLLRS